MFMMDWWWIDKGSSRNIFNQKNIPTKVITVITQQKLVLVKTYWRRLEDVLGRRIANTSSRRLDRPKIVTLKASSRCLGEQQMFAGKVFRSYFNLKKLCVQLQTLSSNRRPCAMGSRWAPSYANKSWLTLKINKSIYLYPFLQGISLIYLRLYVLIMSHKRFRESPHSIVAWMSMNFSLEAGAKSEN